MPSKIVLVADDWPEICQLIAEVVRREGFRVLTAANGAEVLAMALSEIPDVILMDLQMPIIHGCELVRRIRSISHIPIVIISADCIERGAEALADGCNECLQKPVDIGVIREILKRYL